MTALDDRIRDLIDHAYNHAPAVQRLMDEAGVRPADVQTAADLAKLPIISKDRFIQLQQENPPFGGFLAADPETLSYICISPGPIYDPIAPGEGLASGAAPAFRSAGFGRGDRVVNTFMYHLTPAGLGLDGALRELGCTVIPSGPGNTELQIKIIIDLNVTGYVGTPSFLATLFDAVVKMGMPAEALTLRKAFFTAEPYPPSLRQRFEGEYGMKTTSAYGTADVGFVGYEVEGVQGFCITDTVYVEIVDPDTGQPVGSGELGEILVTTFNNTYPLIRFGTGDLGVLADETDVRCEGSQQLLGLFGRSGDAVKVRGMFLHPNQLRAAMARVPQVKHAQAIITRPESESRDHVTVRVELHPEHAGADVAEAVSAHMQGQARLRVDEVVVVAPGEIDPTQRIIRDERKWD